MMQLKRKYCEKFMSKTSVTFKYVINSLKITRIQSKCPNIIMYTFKL